jgi:glycosyltransferase involved in cell wall biosynthesis
MGGSQASVRIGISDVQVPFISGGGEALAKGLVDACREAGYTPEKLTMPFRFSPLSEVERCLRCWEAENFNDMNGYNPDVVIPLRFPAFYVNHRRKVVWLLHQHRAFYDLWDPSAEHTPEEESLRQLVIEKDTFYLSRAEKVYTISRNVSRRLELFNGVHSTPLYHPPPMASKVYHADAEMYIFAPSRLETLKRQWLLIQAAQHLHCPVAILISGDGGQRPQYEKLIETLNLGDRVRLLGRLSADELAGFYSSSLGVFFGPKDEDYGYITLEAMLAKKPVITCSDSGGPLEFVIHGRTGFVVDPTPEAVAEAIESLYANRRRAIELGHGGYTRYEAMGVPSWRGVVSELTRTQEERIGG